MQIGRRFGTFRDVNKTSDKLNWNYDDLLAEFNSVKSTATRYSSGFQVTDLNLGMSSPYQWSNFAINLPDNRVGTWLQTTVSGNDRVFTYAIIYPMENRFELTDLVINYNTAYTNFTWLEEDGKIYRVTLQDKKLYRFNPDGTGWEYLVTILTPNNETAGIERLFGKLFNGKMYFYKTNNSSAYAYASYVDMTTFETWQGTIPTLTYLMQMICLPNGNLLQFNVYGNIKVLDPSFSQIYSANAGSYYSIGFSGSSFFAGMENWIYTGFANHGSSVIAYNYVNNTTKTTSHYKSNYENNIYRNNTLLPTGEHFTWMQYYYGHGLGGNGAVIYNCSNDNLQICIPSDGSTTGKAYRSKLLSNGKLFLYLNYNNAGSYKLVDLGLNTSFSYSFLTSPWFGGGNS